MKNMSNFLHVRLGWWAALLLVLVAAGVAYAETDGQSKRLFMPAILIGPAMDCNVPGASFTSLSIKGEPLTVNPETNRDVNLGARGYKRVNAPLKLVALGSVHDRKAPQLPGMFGDRRTPAFTSAYDADLGPYQQWDVTLLGMGTTKGEVIYTPDSGYDIGGGYEYLVMYASETRVTLHIGREDEFFGYVLHIEDVCVDPDLLALYRQMHAAGRRSLPALRGHDPFGRAMGVEVKAAVRDSGSFMDPRSRNDWWQGR